MMAQVAAQEEEHFTVVDEPTASALLARVMKALAEAAFAESMFVGEVGEDDEDAHEDHCQRATVYYLHVALAAISAAARVHPDVAELPLPRAKEHLLEWLDEEAADWIEAQEESDELGPGYFIRAVAALLLGAAEAASELDCLYEPSLDLPGLDECTADDEESDEEEPVAVRFGESLFQAATVAVAAADWYHERAELFRPGGDG